MRYGFVRVAAATPMVKVADTAFNTRKSVFDTSTPLAPHS